MDCVRHSRGRGRAGVTLVELMVVLVLLSVMAGIVAGTWRPEPPVRTWPTGAREVVASARVRAIESGNNVTVSVLVGDRHVYVTAHPDGRVVGAASLGFDPLTGLPVAADTNQ
jgi:prepilin-type N-terminal cleavage/methylation domain-containing protein